MSTPRLGVCSWSLQPSNPAALLERVRATGLDAVQLALTPIAEEPAVWADAGRRLRDAGIAILSGMLATVGEDYSSIAAIARTGGVRPDETWPKTLLRGSAVAKTARALGLDLVTFHAGFLPHDPADPERERMLDRLRRLAEVFAAEGIDVALETGQESAEALRGCLEDLAIPSIGVNFDPANMILYGSGDPVAAMRVLAPWVRQIHLKDALPSNAIGAWGREVRLGTGAVDWPAFAAEVLRCPRRPNWIVEREAGDDRITDVRAAVPVWRSALDAARAVVAPEGRVR
jgi:sugar phosphate isomerase/epimerase